MIEIILAVCAVIQVVYNVVIGAFVYFVRKQASTIKELEAELKANSELHIQTRLDGLDTRIGAKLDILSTRLGSIDKRLEVGDKEIERLKNQDQKFELQVIRDLGLLKDAIENRMRNQDERLIHLEATTGE